jgi:hypothetical protein
MGTCNFEEDMFILADDEIESLLVVLEHIGALAICDLSQLSRGRLFKCFVKSWLDPPGGRGW